MVQYIVIMRDMVLKVIITQVKKKKKSKEENRIKDKEENKSKTLNQEINTLDKYKKKKKLILFIIICLGWILFINIIYNNNLAENINSCVTIHIKKTIAFNFYNWKIGKIICK